MFEEVITTETVEVIETIRGFLEPFYLGIGTGLALQLGHRISYDLDFWVISDYGAKDKVVRQCDRATGNNRAVEQQLVAARW